jgi:hypothetical protein
MSIQNSEINIAEKFLFLKNFILFRARDLIQEKLLTLSAQADAI